MCLTVIFCSKYSVIVNYGKIDCILKAPLIIWHVFDCAIVYMQ
jgi:hypothetical protein